MGKSLVCILDQEVILNYLFVKEAFKAGDDVLLIVSRRFQPQIGFYRKMFAVMDCPVDAILLEHPGDEIVWDVMCRTIRAHLSEDKHYYVNLSGGTRQMSIAVQQVFDLYTTKFFFLPKDRNVIVHSQIDTDNDNDDDYFYEIQHRITVKEYLEVNGLRCRTKEVVRAESYTQKFYEVFTGGMFSQNDYDVLEALRDHRNEAVLLDGTGDFQNLDGLKRLLLFVEFEQSYADKLTVEEVQYITGGWFEEYVYHLVKRIFNPDDICIGAEISRASGLTSNDIDVAFTIENRLHVIECKTGVGKRKLYNQMVYKACALYEALLGVRSKAYIFSLNNDDKDILYRIAKNMNIVYCDRRVIEDETELKEMIKKV